jgi:protein-S-isoprenylcysteine O-methyltransferase Ste14
VPRDQILIGLTSALLCAAGLWRESWLLGETPKGRKLVAFLGSQRAQWALRCVLAVGLLFGLLLALGVVNPLRWDISREERSLRRQTTSAWA